MSDNSTSEVLDCLARHLAGGRSERAAIAWVAGPRRVELPAVLRPLEGNDAGIPSQDRSQRFHVETFQYASEVELSMVKGQGLLWGER